MWKAFRACLLSVVPLSIAVVVFCPPAHATDLSSIIESVEQRENCLANLVTRVRVQSWATKPFDEELNPKPLLDQEFEIVVRGFRYSIREHLPANPSQNLPESYMTRLWDCRFWHRAAERGDSRSMLREDKPLFDASIDCFGLFQESEIISMVGPSLSYVLSKYVLLNQSEDAETIRVELASDTRKTKICTLTFLKTEPLRLQAAVVDLYDEPGYTNGGEHKLQVEYVVEEWGEYSGHVLPKRARRDFLMLATKERQSRGEKAVRSTSIIERLDASFDSDNPIYEELFRPHPFIEGFSHLDRTLNVAYTIGNSVINVDGTFFEVPEPVVAPPRRNLPEILSDAQAIIPENGQIAPQINLKSGEFYVAEAAVPLKPQTIEELIAVAIIDSDTHPPPQPTIVAPNGVQAEFKGWKLVYGRHEPTKRPARWQALIEIVQTADHFDKNEKLQVTLEGKTELVELTGRPWR